MTKYDRAAEDKQGLVFFLKLEISRDRMQPEYQCVNFHKVFDHFWAEMDELYNLLLRDSWITSEVANDTLNRYMEAVRVLREEHEKNACDKCVSQNKKSD